MKTRIVLTAVLNLCCLSGNFAQEMDYSIYLASGAGVYTSTPSLVDQLIFSSMGVAADFPVTMKYAEPDNTWTNCLWKFDPDTGKPKDQMKQNLLSLKVNNSIQPTLNRLK